MKKSASSAAKWVALAIATLIIASAARASVVYTNDFETSAGPEWSNTTRSVTPVGARTFLGEFGNETVTLSLSGLPAHSQVTLSLDLFVLKSWDGNSTLYGPDTVDIGVLGGPTLLHSTFSNLATFDQAYPGTYPGGSFPAQSSAAEVNTLGYSFYGDSVYGVTFTFSHTGSSLVLNFSGSSLQGVSDESWGLDNVQIDVPAQPKHIAVFGDNYTDDFINTLSGYDATVVSDSQIATPGFLDAYDAFYFTRDGSSFGASLSPAAAAAVFSYVGMAGQVVLLNADFADPLNFDTTVQTLTANAVAFAAASGHGYVGEFNGSVSALTANADFLTPIGLISGSAGPLGGGNGGSSTNINLAPAGVGHPVMSGVSLPYDPDDVEFGAMLTGIDPGLILATFDDGNPAVVAGLPNGVGGSVCGNGIVEGSEQCDIIGANGLPSSCCTASCTFRGGGETCRDPVNDCDAAETCSGDSGLCPSDQKQPSGTPCGNPANSQCDHPDTCDGGGTCLPNYASTGTSCGSPSTTECTNPDTCNGTGSCQANNLANGTRCYGSNNNNCLNSCQAGTCTPGVVPNCCGNGTLDSGELCDDGNQVSGDECKSNCRLALDHFQCYRTGILEAQPAIPPKILVDALETINVLVRKPRTLCNPANKNNEDPTAPSHPDHLETYPIRPNPIKDISALLPLRNTKVVDQFGTLTLDIMWPKELRVPTAKELASTPPPLASTDLDHFTCYQVKRSKGAPRFHPISNVSIEDQFGTLNATVTKPYRLCLPSNKYNENPGAEQHKAHLMCYRVRAPFVSPGRVFTNNQFGPGELLVRSPKEICVPAVRDPN